MGGVHSGNVVVKRGGRGARTKDWAHGPSKTVGHRSACKSFVIWTAIILLAGGAAHLLAWPPSSDEDSWLFKSLNMECPREAVLRELESRLINCFRKRGCQEERDRKYDDEGSLDHVGTNRTEPGEEEYKQIPEPEDPVERDPVERPRETQNTMHAGFVTCKASPEKWNEYVSNFKRGGPCPDDWPLAQDLLFSKDCFQLPPRDCHVRSPPNFEEPLPFSKALWSDPSIHNVDWHHYTCDSFACLRARKDGDCRECFDWKIEATRWNWIEQRNLVLADVLALKKGFLRLGLDVAGGSGSFAALLAAHNVTVVTTGMNSGAPFLETMALRGLPALHLPMKARLPFFAGTFDIIHSQHAVQMLSVEDFEFMLFDWDRVLRPGGLIWLDRLYHPVDVMKLYTDVVALLGYKRHSWNQWSKAGKTVKFTAVLEKPLRPSERHRHVDR